MRFASLPRAAVNLVLVSHLVLSGAPASHNVTPDTSIARWKRLTGYRGEICAVAVYSDNRPYCRNGVTYNAATVNAQHGYDLWATCELYPQAPICKELDQ